jgi:glutamate synthase (NADPH/NADH) small chain
LRPVIPFRERWSERNDAIGACGVEMMVEEELYGFLRYARQDTRRQPARQRIRHWREYVLPMPDRQASQQANRCMDCATPGCHGFCPVHNPIPEWNALVYRDDWRRAYTNLASTNNFPELTGRLCPAPCEDACTLTLADRPVTIKSLELAIAEHAWNNGWVQPEKAAHHRRQTIVIVGSGPAGLACAQQLARAGYRVTVLEKADRVGGLLRYGIPDFRLEKPLLDRRLGQLRAEGVEFVTGVHVGAGAGAQAWLSGADAVVLACGARQPRDLAVPGRELRGIQFAIPYLSAQNRCCAGDTDAVVSALSAKDKDVVVLGGGDTGHDCVGTAIRQGARSVTQVQYHDQPPRHADILCHWPRPLPVLRTADTDQEGARRIWGRDTVALRGGGDRVEQVVLQRLKWYRDDQGAWRKQRVAGSTRFLPAQLVLLAMGYAHPVHEGLVRGLALTLTARGNVQANERDYRTSFAGIFACGDMRRGQSLVVWAIREGRQCARAVDCYLAGHSELPYV